LVGYLAVSDFNGNYRKAHNYCQMLNFVKIPEYSRFIRRINRLEQIIEKLFSWLGELFVKLKGYISSKLEEFLKKLNIKLSPIFKKSMQKVIKATSIGGFLTKLKLFLVAYSINCFLKLPMTEYPDT